MAKDATLEIARINQLKSVAFPERNISAETMKHFGVKAEMSEETGKPSVHYYPYYADDGTVSGYKGRRLPKDFSVGVIGKLRGFFGKKQCHGGKFLIIVEGEQDVLAGYEAMLELGKGPYNIVSLPFGANEDGIIDSTVKKELEWLSAFEKIAICFDDDGPGKATANGLADYVCSHTDVRIVSIPLKDTAAMWEAGKAKEWLACISRAAKYVSEQIVAGDENYEELLEPLHSGIYFDFMPETSRRLDGFRTSEVTGLLAAPNVGKSSIMRQMTYDLLIKQKEPVGAFFLEETTKKTRQSVLAYHSKVPLNAFRRNPTIAEKILLEEARETLLPRLHLFEHKLKTITDDFLERKIEYMVKAIGCKHIFLDHLSFIISGRNGQNERQEIDNLLTRLARSVENWDYALYIVSHIKRPDNSRIQPKSFPYWDSVDMRSGRGSGAIEQLMHKIIGIDNQILQDDDGRGMIRTRILRDREWGAKGVCDYLTWDVPTGTFKPVEVNV